MARSKKVLHYLNKKGNLTKITDANLAQLPMEDQLILSLMKSVVEDGNATAFNAIMDSAYGKLQPGSGPDLGNEEREIELNWNVAKLNEDGKQEDK